MAFYVAAAAGKGALFGVLLAYVVALEPILNHANSLVMFVYAIVFLILEIVFHEIDALTSLGSQEGELVVRALWIGNLKTTVLTAYIVSNAVVAGLLAMTYTCIPPFTRLYSNFFKETLAKTITATGQAVDDLKRLEALRSLSADDAKAEEKIVACIGQDIAVIAATLPKLVLLGKLASFEPSFCPIGTSNAHVESVQIIVQSLWDTVIMVKALLDVRAIFIEDMLHSVSSVKRPYNVEMQSMSMSAHHHGNGGDESENAGNGDEAYEEYEKQESDVLLIEVLVSFNRICTDIAGHVSVLGPIARRDHVLDAVRELEDMETTSLPEHAALFDEFNASMRNRAMSNFAENRDAELDATFSDGFSRGRHFLFSTMFFRTLLRVIVRQKTLSKMRLGVRDLCAHRVHRSPKTVILTAVMPVAGLLVAIIKAYIDLPRRDWVAWFCKGQFAYMLRWFVCLALVFALLIWSEGFKSFLSSTADNQTGAWIITAVAMVLVRDVEVCLKKAALRCAGTVLGGYIGFGIVSALGNSHLWVLCILWPVIMSFVVFVTPPGLPKSSFSMGFLEIPYFWSVFGLTMLLIFQETPGLTTNAEKINLTNSRVVSQLIGIGIAVVGT